MSRLNAAVLSSPSWKSVAKRGTGLEKEEEKSYLLSNTKAELHQYPQHANILNHRRTERGRTAAALQSTASHCQCAKSRMLQQDGKMWKKSL